MTSRSHPAPAPPEPPHRTVPHPDRHDGALADLPNGGTGQDHA
ncbi:hypothetical protein ACWGUP_26895 [Streptomyces diastaticus]